MLIQAERPASRGCVCWVLIPHPELPAAGELTAGQTYVCWGQAGGVLVPHAATSVRGFQARGWPRHIRGPSPPPCWPRLHPAPLSPCPLFPGWQRVGFELGNWLMPQMTGTSWGRGEMPAVPPSSERPPASQAAAPMLRRGPVGSPVSPEHPLGPLFARRSAWRPSR